MSQISSPQYAIFLNGGYPAEEDSFYRHLIEKADCTIAVDGGRSLFERLRLNPDIVLADFDSSSAPNDDYTGEIITFDTDKDKTDGELAIELALTRGAEKVALCGYSGGPATDQVLGNLMLLQRAADLCPDTEVLCQSATERIWFIKDKAIKLIGVPSEVISIVALDAQIRLSAAGVRYPATDTIIKRGETTGHSNKLLGSSCEISIQGSSLVFMRHSSTETKP